MQFLKQSIFLSLIIFSLSTIAEARWPEFKAPDESFLLKNHYIINDNCPIGQGKLLNHISIKIKGELCQTYCPDDWTWITRSDQQCHDLDNGFELMEYDIKIHQDNEGNTSHSQALATYRTRNSNQTAFKMEFGTQPGAYWYCYEMDKERHVISCANDIFKKRT